MDNDSDEVEQIEVLGSTEDVDVDNLGLDVKEYTHGVVEGETSDDGCLCVLPELDGFDIQD